jgi:hypothetical protein
MDRRRTTSQAEGDHIAVQLVFTSALPPDTAPEPVERDLQELATALARSLGKYVSTEVELMTPDHPDHVIERAHLSVELHVLHYDAVGMLSVRQRVERERDRILAFVKERRSARLGRLELTLVRAAGLELRQQWDQWGEDEELVLVGWALEG